jgi:carbonic anhydrase/acetyltransferase-like protein (isoleucine patch superfamily)
MTIYALEGNVPVVGQDVWVAPGAHIMGKVQLDKDVGIWFGAVLRGDNELIHIAEGSNVQEGACLHTDMGYPLSVGEHCTIGHHAMLHGCTVGNNSLIGMGATVLNGAKIGNNCLVGAGALVTEGKVFPDGSLIVGVPAKAVRELTPEQIAGLKLSAENYVKNQKRFAKGLKAV